MTDLAREHLPEVKFERVYHLRSSLCDNELIFILDTITSEGYARDALNHLAGSSPQIKAVSYEFYHPFLTILGRGRVTFEVRNTRGDELDRGVVAKIYTGRSMDREVTLEGLKFA